MQERILSAERSLRDDVGTGSEFREKDIPCTVRYARSKGRQVWHSIIFGHTE